MIHLYNLDDLKLFGINPLTGEADRYCLRILCDLSQRGVDLVCEFFGMQPARCFPTNWNSTVGNEPAVASLMLTRDTLWELALFALLHVEQCDIVVDNQGFVGLNYDERYTEEYLRTANELGHRVYRNYGKTSSAPGIGSRNTHAFSGRTV